MLEERYEMLKEHGVDLGAVIAFHTASSVDWSRFGPVEARAARLASCSAILSRRALGSVSPALVEEAKCARLRYSRMRS